MSCGIKTLTNESESQLFKFILDNIENNEKKAEILYSNTRTEAFKQTFGDYVGAYESENFESFKDRVDDNFEPKFFKDEETQKYYFLDKNYEKVFFPLENRGLRTLYSYKQINKIISRLSLTYFEKSKLDFNNIDFETAEKLPDLKAYVEKEIKNRITELNKGSIKDRINAKSLEKSLNYIDEYVNKIDAFYKQMSIKRVDNVEEDDFRDDGDTIRDEAFDKSSFEKDSKNNVTNNMKLRLSLLKNEQDLDPIWNEPTFLSFDEVYSTLINNITNEVALEGEDIFDLQVEKIRQISKFKPYLNDLIAKLDKFTENEKNEFSRAFNLHKINLLVTEYTNKYVPIQDETGQDIGVEQQIQHSTIQASNSGDRTSRIVTDWGNEFKTLFLNIDNTRTENYIQDINEVVTQLELLKKATTSKQITRENLNKYLEKLVNDLSILGVDVSVDGLNRYLRDNGLNDLNFDKQLIKLSNLASDLVSATTYLRDKSFKKQNDNYINPFNTTKTFIFKQLASSESFFKGEGSDATSRVGKKQYWLFSNPSYISNKIKAWKKHPELLKAHYESSEYTKGSAEMKYLLAKDLEEVLVRQNDGELTDSITSKVNAESIRRLNNFDLGVFKMMQDSEGNSSEASELSFQDSFLDYVHKILKADYNRTTTQADKGTELQIKTGFELKNTVKSYSTATDTLYNEKVLETFRNYFYSEFERMKEAYSELEQFKNSPEKLKVHYHFKKGKKIYDENGNIITANLGNAFKSQYFEGLTQGSKANDELSLAIKDLLYTEDGLYNPYKGNYIKGLNELMNQYITRELNKNLKETKQIFKDLEIVDNDLNNVLIATSTYRAYQERYTHNALASHAMIADFLVNSLLKNIEYSKMFTGDVAYYKDMVDYKKRVPATYTDGIQLRLKQGEEYFNAAVIDSIEIASPIYDELVKSLGERGAEPYKNINSADAQAWITPKRWKFLKERLGDWSDLHDSVYSKMIGENTEPFTEKELKLAAQPLKGVYFDVMTGTPTYLKYSQAVLSPNMVKGTSLERILNKMEKEGVDELITLDGVKVGASTTTRIHNEKGQLLEDDKLQPFNKMQLSNRGWKLQQDLPTKTFKDTEVGSQIQKNIFAGLKFNQDEQFELNGKTLSGKEISDEIVKTITNLTQQGLNKLKKEFKIDANNKIKNVSGFYKALISELEQRGGSENVIQALQKETALYGIPQSMDKLISVFSSIVNKRLIKIKTNGGSFIQMSNFGISKEDGDIGIKWHPDLENGDTTFEPHIIEQDGKKIVKPGSILISGSFLGKIEGLENWKDYTTEELFVDYKGKGPIIDKKIQETIIGYRIPNQGLASNDALRIVGILPESQGDTIVAYTGITTKTGSDFDIDKMYIMFPNYDFENGILKYDENDLSNKLIELYKAVLTNPKVYQDVMKPIDIEFIKREINTLIKDEAKGTLYHFNGFHDLKLRYLFTGGKAGVGQEANALVDISRLGDLSLNTYIGWGHKNNQGFTKFDEEYSQELSKTDLEYYSNATGIPVEDLKAELGKVKVGESLTAILNAFVDIAKDPYVTKGNWVTSTTNSGNLLLRAGMHPLYVTAFMAQPIIKQYIEYLTSQESITKSNTGDMKLKFKRNMVITELQGQMNYNGKDLSDIYQKFIKNEKSSINILKSEKFETDLNKFLKTKLVSSEFTKIVERLTFEHNKIFYSQNLDLTKASLEQFRNQISKQDADFQISILNKFYDIQELSKTIKNNIDVAKLDTNGMGKNITSLFRIFNLKREIIKNEKEANSLLGFNSKFENTTLGAYYDSLIEVGKIINNNPNLFPQGSFKVQEMFNIISKDIYGKDAIDEELMDLMESSYYSYTMARFFDLSSEESTSLAYDFPTEFETFRKENRNKYLILDELELDKKDIVPTIGLNNRKKSSDYEQRIVDSWKDLFIDNPEFAEKLVKYSFIKTGFRMSPTQFFTFIPHEYFLGNNSNERNINQFIEEFSTMNQEDFIEKFYLNNATKSKIIPNVFESMFLSDTEQIFDNGKNFMLSKDFTNRFVAFKNKVYKRVGYDSNENPIFTEYYNLGLTKLEKSGKKGKGKAKVKPNIFSEYGNPFTIDLEKVNISTLEDIIGMVNNNIEQVELSTLEQNVETELNLPMNNVENITTNNGVTISSLGYTQTEWDELSSEQQNKIKECN